MADKWYALFGPPDSVLRGNDERLRARARPDDSRGLESRMPDKWTTPHPKSQAISTSPQGEVKASLLPLGEGGRRPGEGSRA